MTGEGFGSLPDGRPVRRWRIAAGGMVARVMDLGATVQDLHVDGQRVVLGADDPAAYLGDLLYAGAIVGRFANRIGGARFTLDGADHRTDANFLGRHTLHGGRVGSGQRLWRVEEAARDRITLTLDLADGEMGFPGAMRVSCRYVAEPPATLRVVIEARTDRATPCSFAHHGYFVLDGSGDVSGHRLSVAAGHYLPVDDDLIPTGEVAPVGGTRFDFRAGRDLGQAGYDHCLCPAGAGMRPVARLESAAGGLALEVATDRPGLQVYDGAHLAGCVAHGGTVLRRQAGIALEAQAWPDAPNRPGFPDAILRPGAVWRSETVYSFAPGRGTP